MNLFTIANSGTSKAFLETESVNLLSRNNPMADNSAPRKRRKTSGAQKLQSEINALRKHFKPARGERNQLTWDTELLVKKTQTFKTDKVISAKDPGWKQAMAEMDIGRKGICISDVRNVDAIEFIAAFAAKRQLTMTYGNGSFLLEPRD
jgi:hypothetical protein